MTISVGEAQATSVAMSTDALFRMIETKNAEIKDQAEQIRNLGLTIQNLQNEVLSLTKSKDRHQNRANKTFDMLATLIKVMDRES